MLNSTESTRRFLTDLRKIQRKPKSENDRKKYVNRNIPSTVERLYDGNTDSFEPTQENREHLLNTMLPMVYSIARQYSSRFGRRIELDDCINAGIIGAAIATDKYIEKSKYEKQPAKLSSYTYPFIKKYIKEFCEQNNSPLSHSSIEWIGVNKNTWTNSGNELVNDGSEGKRQELFDLAPTERLKVRQDDEKQEKLVEARKYARKLFENLNEDQRNIVLLKFGITSTAMSIKEISKKLAIRQLKVKKTLQDALDLMRNSFDQDDEIMKAIHAIRETNISKFIL